MIKLLRQSPDKKIIPKKKIDEKYKRMRLQVFFGIFIGYAGYYLVRKNFALAMPDLVEQGFSKLELGFALSGVAIAYGLSKFLMGNVSDRSDARKFMPIGLLMSGIIMVTMGFFPFATSSVTIMFLLLLLNGWFQGMGWPPSGRIMVQWFSIRERGTKMSFWNTAHNIGGGLIGPLAIL
ncbi:Glycerol-3-phosphate transporter, partial [hydrothermal vent metagenome]